MLFLLLTLGLGGFGALFFAVEQSSMEAVPDWTIPVRETPTPTPAQPVTGGPGCAFMWATQDLPALAAEVEAALSAADVPFDTVLVTAFGENCVDASGEVVNFYVMQTEFEITLPVESTADDVAMGERALQVLDVLTAFPSEETPGPGPGFVRLIMDDGSGTLWLTADYDAAMGYLDAGLSPVDLVAAMRVPTR
jgi:hypothetical protein